MSLDDPPAVEPRHTFEFSVTDGPSRAVVDAVASTRDADPSEIDQLYAAVDPDALDAFFARYQRAPGTGRVEFEYGGFLVAVEAAGRGYLYELDRVSGPEVTA